MSEPEGGPTEATSNTSRPAKRTTSTKAKRPTKKPGRPSTVEEEGIFSGRLVTAAVISVLMVVLPLSPISRLITKSSPTTAQRSVWKVGSKKELHITVVTADYKKLACADERIASNGAHCEFKAEREPFPKTPEAPVDDNKKNILQPYRTTDGQLIYLAGFWSQPDIALRLHDEPAQGVAESKLARFVASCEVSFLDEWSDPKLRWSPSERFSSPTNSSGKAEPVAMVGHVESCRILEDERH